MLNLNIGSVFGRMPGMSPPCRHQSEIARCPSDERRSSRLGNGRALSWSPGFTACIMHATFGLHYLRITRHPVVGGAGQDTRSSFREENAGQN